MVSLGAGDVKTLAIVIRIDTKQVRGALNKVRTRMQRLGQDMKANEGRFQGWALSVMFFGMAIQRVFLGIWKFGTKAFQEVAHSVEGMVTQTDMLAGSMKFLGIVVGSALEPLAAALIPIVEKISDWVQQNPELTAEMVKWGSIIGSFLLLVGLLVLGFTGVFTAVANVGSIIAAVLGGAATGGAAFLLASVVIAIIAVIAWLVIFTIKVGGIGEAFKAVFRSIVTIASAFRGVVAGIVAEMVNFIKMMWNGVVQFIEDGINLAISKINSLIDALNTIPFINISNIGEADLGNLRVSTLKMGEAFGDAFSKVMLQNMDFINRYLPLKRGNAESGGLFPSFDKVREQVVAGGGDPSVTTIENNVYIDKFENNNPDFEEFLRALEAQGLSLTPNSGGD